MFVTVSTHTLQLLPHCTQRIHISPLRASLQYMHFESTFSCPVFCADFRIWFPLVVIWFLYAAFLFTYSDFIFLILIACSDEVSTLALWLLEDALLFFILGSGHNSWMARSSSSSEPHIFSGVLSQHPASDIYPGDDNLLFRVYCRPSETECPVEVEVQLYPQNWVWLRQIILLLTAMHPLQSTPNVHTRIQELR
jgi:hypothetical protein